MNDIFDFIRINIKIRNNEIENSSEYNINKNCLKLLDQHNLLNMSFLTNPDNYNLIYRISSKAFDTSTMIISNRLVGLSYMLANTNYITGIEFENIKHVQKFKYFLISFYILAGQVFSDGNHMVCYYYLLEQGIDENKISNTIGTIDLCRRQKNIDWLNLHDFIQIFINNLFYVINKRDENMLLEKIENLFI